MGKIKRQNVNTHLLGPPSSFAGNANMKETTPTPRITGFPLPEFPLMKISVYVHIGGGIIC